MLFPVVLTALPLLLAPRLAEKAEERKREQDILYERQLAKERAAGGHQPLAAGTAGTPRGHCCRTSFEQCNPSPVPDAPLVCSTFGR